MYHYLKKRNKNPMTRALCTSSTRDSLSRKGCAQEKLTPCPVSTCLFSIQIWYGPDLIHAVRYICNKLSWKQVENAHVLLFCTHRLCLHTAKDWHQACIFSRMKMNLIKLFFISVGATLQPLLFNVIVGLSTLCNS